MSRILIIEPDAFGRSLLAHVLTAAGYEVSEAIDAETTFDAAREAVPDLVLAAIGTSDLAAFEILQNLQHHQAIESKTPIVILSTQASRETVLRAARLGVSAFLTKQEFAVDAFLNRVAGLLGGEPAKPKNGSAQVSAQPQPSDPHGGAPEVGPPKPNAAQSPGEAEPSNSGASPYQLPRSEKLAELFESMVGTTVTVSAADRPELDAQAVCAIAVFINDEGELAATGLADAALVNNTGCALSLIPVGQAQDNIAKQEVEGEALDNFSEVMNVASSLFNLPDMPHVKLKEMLVAPADSIPDEVSALISDPAKAGSWEIDVEGYGKGTLSILLTGAPVAA